tara:strand:+ start:1141 stop:1950 length:810 start_codon:yes stop_codon:yes gene_type:complete
MAYIGNTAGNRFVASKTATQFSGNGSAVDFTLDHSVSSPEDILVSVDGVVQEPTVAYGIVSGTTLRFTAAPSSNSGNNIFVYYLFRTVGTVSPPDNSVSTNSLQNSSVNLTSKVTGILPVANGGTGFASYGTVFKLISTANQDLNNGVETVLTFNSAPIDTASITSTTNNNVTITAATAGTWLIQGNSRINQRPGRQQLLFLIGSTITLMGEQSENDAGSGANPTIGFSSIIALSDGDVLTMKHWQSSGGTLNTVAGYSQPSLMGLRLF